MASRWDADRFAVRHPVLSLRSTTGYRLRSFWDQDGPAASEHHFADASKMISPFPCSVGLRPSHSAIANGKSATVTDSRYNEAREVESQIAENVSALLEA